MPVDRERRKTALYFHTKGLIVENLPTDITAAETAKPPISEARHRANVANSKSSTGPRTDAGKKRSSLNAVRSGIHGQLTCLPVEDLAALQKLTADIVAEYNPFGPTELFWATSVAEAMFRLQRIRSLENGIFAQGFRDKVDAIDTGIPEVDASLAAADTFLESAREIALLSVYEQRQTRSLEKALAQLKTIQAERKAAREKAVEQATTFVKHGIRTQQPYEPGEDFEPASDWGGFVFSEDEILRVIDRDIRFDKAWRTRFDRPAANPGPDSGPKPDMAA